MKAVYLCGLIALTLAAARWDALADPARATPTPSGSSRLAPSRGEAPSSRLSGGGRSSDKSSARPTIAVQRARDSGRQHATAPAVSGRDGGVRLRWLATPANRTVDSDKQAGPPVFRTAPEQVDRKTPPPVRGGDGVSRTRHHRHGHDAVVIVVLNWYTWPPYCYTSDIGTHVYYGAPPNGSDYSADTDYYDYGYGWAQGFRDGLVEWDELIGYLRDYIIDAAPESIAEFRRGFVAGYGINGVLAFDRAMDSANE